MSDIDNLIKIAEAEVGYLEKKTNNQLDSKTANAGYGNYTKYARDLDNISGFYNGKKNGFAWCDIFVDWCFVKAFGVDKAKKLLCQPSKSLGAGCDFSMQYYRKNKQIYNVPKRGDQIFFKQGGGIAHTGLVYKVDNLKVYTIEGNTSSKAGVVANGGCVAKKSYNLNSSYIAGYGRPKYENSSTSKPVANTKKKYTETFPVLPKRGYFYYPNKIVDKGTQVKNLQMFLNWAVNTRLTVDGYCGNLTKKAILLFQKTYKLTQDGCFGKQCLSKAKTIEK